MSHPEAHAQTDAPPYFPATQWEQFQADDIAAGRAIILLMSSIFTIGLLIYTIIAIQTGT